MDLAAFTFGEGEALAIALGVTEVAAVLAQAERDDARMARKGRIVAAKHDVLRGMGLDLSRGTQALLRSKAAPWDEAKRTALLIEVTFADPFAPYQVKVDPRDHARALGMVAETIGLSPQRADQILAARASARKAHKHIPWAKIGIATVVGAVVVAAGGYLAAPAIAAYLGGAAGLSGAAAVAHGLALLGGGSLAAGGAGMAGGMALIAGGGAAAGALGFGGAAAFWQAGRAAAVSELVKLQVAYREVLLRSHLRSVTAAQVIEKLTADRDALRKRIAEEKDLNDVGSARVEDLEAIERGYTDALEWLRDEDAANGNTRA